MLKKQQLVLAGSSAVLALALDLLTKRWAWDTLRAADTAIFLWKPHLELRFSLNTGTAFSLVRDLQQPWLFGLVAAAVLGYVAYVTARSAQQRRPQLIGLGLIVAGALGNLHDRFFRVDEWGRHGVVDFIKVNFPWGGSWPSFNIADAALVIGVALVLLAARRSKVVN